MKTPIAVLFIHGVEIRDPEYARSAIVRLRRDFAQATGGAEGAEQALEIEPAYWIPAVAPMEDRLNERTYRDPNVPELHERLNRLVGKADQGDWLAAAPLLAATVMRRIPGISRVDYPVMRWLLTYFIGDAIGYQVTKSDSRVYDAIHARVAMALRALAKRAGPEAPLCIIAHSLGTVIASDHIYDLQQALVPRATSVHTTPLERGETLALLYTLGSVIPIWTLRHESLAQPIAFPAPDLPKRYPDLAPSWINFYDRDDVAASPLKGLSPEYDKAVSEDREVAVGPPILRQTPLSHIFYWNTDAVMTPIARALAETWNALPDPDPPKRSARARSASKRTGAAPKRPSAVPAKRASASSKRTGAAPKRASAASTRNSANTPDRAPR